MNHSTLKSSAWLPTQPIDKLMLAFLTLLVSFGLVMVYETTIDRSIEGELRYLIKQFNVLCLGVVLMFGIAWLVPRNIKPFLPYIAYAIIIASIFTLGLVLVEFMGHKVKGSTRWLFLLGFSLQPSEFVKVGVIVYIAFQTERYYMASSNAPLKHYLLSIAIPLGLIFGLLAKQPDYGTIMVMGFISFSMVMLAVFVINRNQTFMRTRIKWLVLGIICVLLIAAGAWMVINTNEYIQQRIATFLNATNDPLKNGYQITQSLIAYARGGFTGQGLGNTTGYIPEKHNDFILAVIGEEFGFLGVVIVIVLLSMLIKQLFWLARRTSQHKPNVFGSMCIYGVGIMIATQFILNVLITLNLFPVTGLTLPFVSYGGSSLLALCLSMGIVFYVQRNTPPYPKQPGY